jgi:hypothetical protein
VDSSDLEPRQKICLIDTLEAVYGEEVQSEEILILHHGSDLLTSDQRAALHAGSKNGHFEERYLVLERVVMERMMVRQRAALHAGSEDSHFGKGYLVWRR